MDVCELGFPCPWLKWFVSGCSDHCTPSWPWPSSRLLLLQMSDGLIHSNTPCKECKWIWGLKWSSSHWPHICTHVGRSVSNFDQFVHINGWNRWKIIHTCTFRDFSVWFRIGFWTDFWTLDLIHLSFDSMWAALICWWLLPSVIANLKWVSNVLAKF